ncbi:MAG: hypothetical protein P9M14_09110 [Candidatus Alcyoniella australis]|nr:hypothetical protein [Candidatus Alcyoniella australis]
MPTDKRSARIAGPSGLKLRSAAVSEHRLLKACGTLMELIGERAGESRPSREYKEQLNRLLGRIGAITRLYGYLELIEFQGALMANDVMLGFEFQHDPAVQSLLLLLARNRLRRIKFMPELKSDELDLLCFWLSHGMVDPSKPRATSNLYLTFQAGLEPLAAEFEQQQQPAVPVEGHESHTPPLGVLREPVTSSYRYDKVLYEEQARLVGKRKVSIFVLVGEIRLDGALVRIVTDEGLAQRETKNGQAAIYYLTRGGYKAEVNYDKFTVNTDFNVLDDDLELEVDLQAYDKY